MQRLVLDRRKKTAVYKNSSFLYTTVLCFTILIVCLIWWFSGIVTDAFNYIALININIFIISIISFFIVKMIVVSLLDRRGKLKYGNLHSSLMWMFAIIAIVPAILITALSLYLFNNSIESWFSKKIESSISESSLIAQAYVDLYEKDFLDDLISISHQQLIEDSFKLYNLPTLSISLKALSDKFNIDNLYIFGTDTGFIVSANEHFGDIPNIKNFTQSKSFSVFTNREENKIFFAVLVKNKFYLVGEKWINNSIYNKINSSEYVYSKYYELKNERFVVKLILSLFLIFLTILTLSGAIWAAIKVADKIVKPITVLVHALNRVSAGDFNVKLNAQNNDEIGMLTNSFNRMSTQLSNSRNLLEKKNIEIDERRKQMEAVLKGVTAGVISLDSYGNIRWFNERAHRLFNLKNGNNIVNHSNDLFELYKFFLARPSSLKESQIRAIVSDGTSRVLVVRFVPQFIEGGKVGSSVVTFDDVTPLLSAQKTAAWRDVARRLAHEIKNPLTPIKLSAERLKRKYSSFLPESDKSLFNQLIDTIIRQTEDMTVMTNEFSDFARLPTSTFKTEDIDELISTVLTLHKMSRSHILFEKEINSNVIFKSIWIDRSQFSQLFGNLIVNSINAIEERNSDSSIVPATGRGRSRKVVDDAKSGTELQQGHIKVVVRMPHDDMFEIEVLDDGKGLPPDIDPEQLFEPYVTTREKGTGLGLAIIRRIVDDHGGDIALRRRPEGGTSVLLKLPRRIEQIEQATATHHEAAQGKHPDDGDSNPTDV